MAGLGWLKRRKILVDLDLQVGLSLNMLGWLYFYVVMFAVVVNARGLWAIFIGGDADPEYFDAVQRLQWFTKFTVVPLLCMFLCVAVHGVVFAHRVAGPVQRIKSTLRDIAARRYPSKPVTLRPSDYLHDVAVELTTLVDSIRDDASRVRRLNRRICSTVARAAIWSAANGIRVCASSATVWNRRSSGFSRHRKIAARSPSGSWSFTIGIGGSMPILRHSSEYASERNGRAPSTSS